MNTVGGKFEIMKKIISVGLNQIGTIKFKGHEHNASKDHDFQVNLADQTCLFAPSPPKRWIKNMQVLPICSRLVVFCSFWIVKNAWLDILNQSPPRLKIWIKYTWVAIAFLSCCCPRCHQKRLTLVTAPKARESVLSRTDAYGSFSLDAFRLLSEDSAFGGTSLARTVAMAQSIRRQMN
jgi:hypothetical protein